MEKTKKFAPVLIGLCIVGILFIDAKLMPRGIVSNLLFGSDELDVEYTPLPIVIIRNGTKSVSLNCKNLKDITIPDSVTELKLTQLKDGLAAKLDLPENLEGLTIIKSPDLTDKGFGALKIPESVQRLTVGDTIVVIDDDSQLESRKLKNIAISNNLEYLKICVGKDSTVDVKGDVQRLFIDGLYYVDLRDRSGLGFGKKTEFFADGVTVNVNGNVESLVIENVTSSAREEDFLAVNVNGNVGGLNIKNAKYSEVNVNGGVQELKTDSVEDFSVNGSGQLDRCSFLLRNSTTSPPTSQFSLEFVSEVDKVHINMAPRVLNLSYEWTLALAAGVEKLNLLKNRVDLPEGIKILNLVDYEHESLEIPGSVRALWIKSNTLDFDALKIPEGILYYKLDSDERDDHREYRAKNCPQELGDFNDSVVLDLSGY